MNTPQECKHFSVCSANLCPLDDSLHKRTWYPSGPICRCRKFQILLWVQKQKRIAKIAGDDIGYFDHEMLNRNFRVSRGLKGLNADKPLDSQKRQWLSGHKDNKKRKASRQQIDRLRKHRFSHSKGRNVPALSASEKVNSKKTTQTTATQQKDR